MHELQLPSSNAQMRFAQLGPSHGYRIDGDSAELNAEIGVNSQEGASALALQLWACDEPYQGGALSGFKVAETRVQVPALQHTFVHDATSFARPPARARDYAMVLVLGTERAEGLQVVDFANYPQRQRFVVPHMLGSASYELASDDSVSLRVARVFNPRGEGNLSGSLELQLWALTDPYAAGEPNGTRLASAQLGLLEGQASFEAVERHAPLSRPDARESHVALLLCEWTAEGYLVRDFCNFAEPYIGSRRAEQPHAATPVVAATSPVAAPAATATTPAVAPAVAATSPAAVSSPAAAPASVKPVVPTAPKPGQRPSLNEVSEAEFIKATGLQKKVAAQLLAARPFKSFEELLALRGIGEKMVQRLRTLYSL